MSQTIYFTSTSLAIPSTKPLPLIHFQRAKSNRQSTETSHTNMPWSTKTKKDLLSLNYVNFFRSISKTKIKKNARKKVKLFNLHNARESAEENLHTKQPQRSIQRNWGKQRRRGLFHLMVISEFPKWDHKLPCQSHFRINLMRVVSRCRTSKIFFDKNFSPPTHFSRYIDMFFVYKPSL